jgi:hypothetical protein
MPFRPFAYRLIWTLCLALALFGARSAEAAAPICDERGASAIAPPPVLPIRDVRAEAAPPPICPDFETDTDGAAFVPGGSRPIPTPDSAAVDAWIATGPANLPRAAASLSLTLRSAPLALAPGHRPSVFRPPRI